MLSQRCVPAGKALTLIYAEPKIGEPFFLFSYIFYEPTCSMKKIKDQGISYNSLWISTFVVQIRAQKVFSLGQIYFSLYKHAPVKLVHVHLFYTKSKYSIRC